MLAVPKHNTFKIMFLFLVEPERWVTHQNQRKDQDHLHHHHLRKYSRQLCHCCDFLTGHLPRSGHFPFKQPTSYVDAYPGVCTCPDTTVCLIIVIRVYMSKCVTIGGAIASCHSYTTVAISDSGMVIYNIFVYLGNDYHGC